MWGVIVFHGALLMWVFINYNPRTMINAGGLVVHEKKKPPGREGFRKWLESTKGPAYGSPNRIKLLTKTVSAWGG